jgi:hypothetical protein
MRIFVFIVSLVILTTSCQTELLKTKKKAQVSEQQELNLRTINDSTFSYELVNKKWINVSIINSAEHFSMLVNRFGMKDSIDFDKENIQAKSPELESMNDQFICLTTWWSADFFSSLIIPVQKRNKPFMYFEHGIHVHDLKKNRIVYTDQFMDKKVCFAVENLVTRKKQRIYWGIPSNHMFHPYCDSMVLLKNSLIIWNASKSTKFPIDLNP